MSVLYAPTTVFPRPATAQEGWWPISAPAFVPSTFPWSDQGRSFLPPSPNRQLYRLLDQPQFDWQTIDLTLWEVPWGTGTWDQTNSFRAPDANKDRTFILQGQPQFDWLTAPLTLWEVPWGAGTQAQTNSFRAQDAKKDRTFLQQEQPPPAWIYVNLPNPFSTALWPAIAPHSFRTPARSMAQYAENDQPQFDWLTPPLSLWEVPWGAGTWAQSQSFRTTDQKTDKTYLLQGQPDSPAWMTVNLPNPFSAALWPAIQPHSFRSPQRNMAQYYQNDQPLFSWLDAVLPLWEVPWGASTWAQSNSFRSQDQKTDKSFILQGQPAPAWITVNLPAVFNPQLYPAIEALARSARSDDARKDKNFILQNQPDLAWIDANLPAPFNAQFWPALQQALLSYRSQPPAKDVAFIRQQYGQETSFIPDVNFQAAPTQSVYVSNVIQFSAPSGIYLRITRGFVTIPAGNLLRAGNALLLFRLSHFAKLYYLAMDISGGLDGGGVIATLNGQITDGTNLYLDGSSGLLVNGATSTLQAALRNGGRFVVGKADQVTQPLGSFPSLPLDSIVSLTITTDAAAPVGVPITVSFVAVTQNE